MSDVLAEIDGLVTAMFDSAETQIDFQAEMLLRARAWIERWAPVVEAATKSQRAGATLLAAAQGNLDERYISAAVANVEDTTAALWSAVAAALGENKP